MIIIFLMQIKHAFIRWWLKQKKRPTTFSTRTTPVDHSAWHELLQQYVDDQGHVDYDGFQHARTSLDKYCQHLSEGPPAGNRDEILAYWINAYNAFTIQAVLRFAPNNSLREADQLWKLGTTVFDRKFFQIGKKGCSLNIIEHQVLRLMDEPRIHFAINCASGSCPALRPEAYNPKVLTDQLEAQTKHFLSDAKKNELQNDKWALSPLFLWYADDFGGVDGVRTFLEKQTKLAAPQRLDYKDYDWTLNKKT